MQFGYAIVYVADVAATVAFWERAFGLTRRFVHESGTYAEMETGATALAFAAPSMAHAPLLATTPTGAASPLELCLVTDDPEAAMARALAAGAALVHAVEQKPWGQRVGIVRDLDGTLVELCTPVSA